MHFFGHRLFLCRKQRPTLAKEAELFALMCDSGTWYCNPAQPELKLNMLIPHVTSGQFRLDGAAKPRNLISVTRT